MIAVAAASLLLGACSSSKTTEEAKTPSGEAGRGEFGQRGEQDLVGMGGIVVGGGVGNPYFGPGLHHDADVGEAAAAELADEAAVGGGAVAKYPVAFLQEAARWQDGGAGR